MEINARQQWKEQNRQARISARRANRVPAAQRWQNWFAKMRELAKIHEEIETKPAVA
jgi:hypothetical protein